MKNEILITVEGVAKIGKTTIIQNVIDFLTKNGVEVEYINPDTVSITDKIGKFPIGTKVKIKEYCRHIKDD